jgi:hypothetical protein
MSENIIINKNIEHKKLMVLSSFFNENVIVITKATNPKRMSGPIKKKEYG